MRIFLSGGEKGSHRNILRDNEVQRIALNVTQYAMPKRKEVDLKQLLGGAEVLVYTSEEDEDMGKLDEFIRANYDDISFVVVPPGYSGDWLGDKMLPLWNDGDDLERLAHLCQKYGRVAISDKALSAKSLPRIRQLQQRWGCTMVALTSKVDMLEAIEWDVAVVTSWTSVIRYGETQVWDGHGLKRYPAQKKESARRANRQAIVRLGIDYDAVMEDDVKEVANLAVRSWLAWESGAYNPDGEVAEVDAEGSESGQVIATTAVTPVTANLRNGGSLIATAPANSRGESGRQLLPVLGIEVVQEVEHEGDDDQGIPNTPEPVLTYNSSGIRQCDSCYLAAKCPRFEEHAECAYEIPISIKTKTQLRAVMRALLEMQSNRIMFAAFSEQLEGQGIDPVLSKELDRFFDMTEKMKRIEDTSSLVEFEIKAKGEAGVLSRIFGPKVGEKAASLPAPISSQALEQAIIDADIVDDR